MKKNPIAEILKEAGAEKEGIKFYSLMGRVFPDEKETCDEVVRSLKEAEG